MEKRMPPLSTPVLKSYNAFATGQSRLPQTVHCPVCGEIMLNINLKPDEMTGAIASGALAARKLSCGCGTQGVLALRKTPGEGLYLYSLTFWIMPKTAEKQGTLSNEELKRWLKNPPPIDPLHA